jgi:hypothetical protein
MPYSLVCEGACNPTLPILDAAVKAERNVRKDKHGHHAVETFASIVPGRSKSIVPPISDELGVRLRTLVHTPHEPVKGDSDRYACTVCGCGRRF